MNKYFKIIVLGVLVCSTAAISAPPNFNLDFNYQGQLLDNGQPANDDYDITIEAFDAVTDGATLSFGASEHLGVTVTNGLFSIDTVNLEIYQYTSDPMWLEIKVRKTSVGGAYDTLTPRQKHQAAPLARTIISDYADFGEVLTHGTYGWIAQPNVHFSGDYSDLTSTPWVANGSNLDFTTGGIGVGKASTSSAISIDSGTEQLVSQFYGPENMFNAYYEDGLYRGYVGSFFGEDADFNIGSASGDMLITTDGVTRVLIEKGSEGGGSIFTGKVKAPHSGDADVKAHVYGKINGTGSGSIVSSGSSDGFSVVRTAVGIYRITLSTPATFNDYSVLVTVVDQNVPQIATIISSATANSFDINIWNLAGNHVDSFFDFVVFKK